MEWEISGLSRPSLWPLEMFALNNPLKKKGRERVDLRFLMFTKSNILKDLLLTKKNGSAK